MQISRDGLIINYAVGTVSHVFIYLPANGEREGNTLIHGFAVSLICLYCVIWLKGFQCKRGPLIEGPYGQRWPGPISSWYCNIRWRGHLPGPRGQVDLILAGDILLIEHLAMDRDMIIFEGSRPMLSAGIRT